MRFRVLAICLFALLGAIGAFFFAEHLVRTPIAPSDQAELEVTIPKGASGRTVGSLLEMRGLIRSTSLWRYFLWRRGGLSAKAGRFMLSREMDMPTLAQAIEGTPLPEDEAFVIIEGWRLSDTDAALVTRGWIEPGDYVKAASRPSDFKAAFPLPTGEGQTLEGYLYPETYGVVPHPLDVHGLLQRQLDLFAERLYLPKRSEISQSGRNLHELVIMASMLEREESTPAQRPLVAGILWKRIDRNIPLGVDATSRYELKDWNDRQRFLERLRDPRDPWNTRTRAGLPPGPIGSPTDLSFQAALQPIQSEFLYYLHDAERKLHPARTSAEHETNRKTYNVY